MTRPDQAAKGPVAMISPLRASGSTRPWIPGNSAQALKEELIRPPTCLRGPAEGNHQRDVGDARANPIEADVAPVANVQLGHAAQTLDPVQVCHECHTPREAVVAPPQAPGHDRAKPVGTDREPGVDGAPSSFGVAHQGPRDRASIIEELLRAQPLFQLGARPSGGVHQVRIENPPGHRKSRGAIGMASGPGEEAG